MSKKDEIIQNYSEKYPGIGSYMECISRAYMNGLATGGLSFGISYFAQQLIRTKHSPLYSQKTSILISSLIAVIVSYYVTTERTKICHAAWMAYEDKHTILNPISEREKSTKEKNTTSDK